MGVSIARVHSSEPIRAGREQAEACAARAAFEIEYERWLPRVYRFAAARLPSTGEAEEVTRKVFERAFGNAFFQRVAQPAPQLLALVKAELARREADSLT